MSATTPNEFFSAFHLRQACCEALLELSVRQSELIVQDNYTEMLEVLHSKQSLIDHLGLLSKQQQHLQTTWKSQRERMAATDRAKCEEILSKTERLMAAVLSSEQSSTQELMARRQMTERELRSLSAGVQAQLAYQSRPPTIASRLDLDT